MGGKMRASECLEHPDLPGEKKTLLWIQIVRNNQSSDNDNNID